MIRSLLLSVFILFAYQLSFAAAPQGVVGTKGVVSSRSLLASEVGVEILKQGGNAVDAAVAVGFALAVTYPSAGNIGGGGFLVLQLEDGTTTTLDFRETAPLTATRDMYLDGEGNVIDGLSTRSHKAIGVPGTVAGLLEALAKYGTLTRKQVLQPAIDLALKGFALPRDLASQFSSQLPRMKKYPASIAKFSRNGAPYKEGEIWQQKDLANSLIRIAKNGRAGFYTGETAQLIVDEMQRSGGLISFRDLETYKPVWREPIRGEYRGYDIISMPPPSSGGVLLVQMLNMLEPYEIGDFGWHSAKAMHVMIEAQRRAYADRAVHLGDPDFYDVPQAKLISKAYAKSRFSDFDPNKASDSDLIGSGSWPDESPETTHYSVVDSKGNAVSVTTTLNLSYGSKIVAAGSGILMNNEMDDFSIKPLTPNSYGLIGGEANAIKPGKRMLSSMTPTIVSSQGKPYIVTGSPGGSTIINTVLQVVTNVIDHDMNIAQAVSAPRFHHQWQPNRIIIEAYGVSIDTLDILRAKGHQQIIETGWKIGDANSILIGEKEIFGISDPRNAGGAVAF